MTLNAGFILALCYDYVPLVYSRKEMRALAHSECLRVNETFLLKYSKNDGDG